MNLLQNGQKFCKKLVFDTSREDCPVTLGNVNIAFTSPVGNGLEISSASIYDGTSTMPIPFSPTSVGSFDLGTARYIIQVCFTVTDASTVSCPINIAANITYDNCDGNAITKQLYHECQDCSFVKECETKTTLLPGAEPGTYIFINEAGDEFPFTINEIDMDINQVDISGSVVTFTAEDGTTAVLDICQIIADNCPFEETLTSLNFDPNTLILTYVDEEGTSAPFDLNVLVSAVSQTVTEGNQIAVHESGDGTQTPIFETVTNISSELVGTTLTITYVNEDVSQAPIDIDLSQFLDDTDTTYTLDDNSDGTITLNGSDGSTSLIDICQIILDNCPSDGDLSVSETTDADGNTIYTITHTASDGSEQTADIVVPPAVSDSLVVINNADGTKTATHTAVDGTVVSWCIPTCNTTIVSETGETFALDSNCGWQKFDLSTNDSPCQEFDEDGNLVATSVGTYVIEDIQMPKNVEFQLSQEGCIWVKPRVCSEPFVFSLATHIVCPDGTKSNSVSDVFTFVPPPIGSIRVDKQFNVEEAVTGDQVVLTITVCNDPSATGPITDINVSDPTPTGLTYITDDGSTVTGAFITPALTWGFPGPLQPGECASLDVTYEVTATDGWEFIPNIVQATANDGVNGPNSTSDSAIDVLNELQFAEATLDWGETNGSTGVVSTTSQTYTKQPTGALIPCGVPYRYEVFLEDGTLWETITGTLCDNNYVSDRTDGLSILDFSFSGDFGNGLSISFNKRDWANATGFNYAAMGNSAQNGNQPISELSNLDARTFAQILTTEIRVGGQGSTECPIESEPYKSEINKIYCTNATWTRAQYNNTRDAIFYDNRKTSWNCQSFDGNDVTETYYSFGNQYTPNSYTVFTDNAVRYQLVLDVAPLPDVSQGSVFWTAQTDYVNGFSTGIDHVINVGNGQPTYGWDQGISISVIDAGCESNEQCYIFNIIKEGPAFTFSNYRYSVDGGPMIASSEGAEICIPLADVDFKIIEFFIDIESISGETFTIRTTENVENNYCW